MMHRRACGFTLIELMVVITIVGILTAMIVPEFAGTYRSALLSSSAREIISILRLARSQAVTTARSVRFRWNTAEHKYILEQQHEALQDAAPAAGRSSSASADFELITEVPGCSGKVDPRISIEVRPLSASSAKDAPPRRGDGRSSSPGASFINFRPDGTADPREIVLADEAGTRLALRVRRSTGRVDLVKLLREGGK